MARAQNSSHLPIEKYVNAVDRQGGIYSTLPAVFTTSVTISGALTAGTLGISGSTVATGATTAATLGDIGGSGPATAAQNSWLPVVAGGTTYFVPVWL